MHFKITPPGTGADATEEALVYVVRRPGVQKLWFRECYLIPPKLPVSGRKNVLVSTALGRKNVQEVKHSGRKNALA